MDSKIAVIDNLSGKFFLAGLFLSKLSLIPIRTVAPVISVLSLVSYLIGYSMWYAAAWFYPDSPRRRQTWYGFSQFKEQYQISALIGIFATLLCLINPSLALPAMGLFTLSTFIWFTCEIHRFYHPPIDDNNYSTERQKTYLHYVSITLSMSIITTLAVGFALLFPVLSTATLITSTIVTNSLLIVALYYWKKCIFDDFPKDGHAIDAGNSTALIQDHLSTTVTPATPENINKKDNHQKPPETKSHPSNQVGKHSIFSPNPISSNEKNTQQSGLTLNRPQTNCQPSRIQV